jgi:hypothetical protein
MGGTAKLSTGVGNYMISIFYQDDKDNQFD